MAIDSIGTTLFANIRPTLTSGTDNTVVPRSQTRLVPNTPPQPQRNVDTSVADPEQIRRAINNQIDQDIQRGIISDEQAQSLRDALDDLDRDIAAQDRARRDAQNVQDDSYNQALVEQRAARDEYNRDSLNAAANATETTTTDSTAISGVTTTVSQRGWVTTTTTYADGSQASVQSYDASQDLTRTNQSNDQVGVSALLEERLRANPQTAGTIPYADTLLSQNRLDIYA